MAARPLWKGHLRFSLVTIPIRIYPATNPEGAVRFHQLHRKCQTRIEYRKWCPHCDQEVAADDIVKGYEVAKGRYVALEPEDIKAVRPESTRLVRLEQVAPAADLDPVYIDAPYFVAPDGKAAAESFAVFREAIAGKAAIGTVAMHGRDRLVALMPRDAGLVMFTLRHDDDVRAIDSLPELDDVPSRVAKDEVTLARKVLAGFERALDVSKFRDTYEDALRQLIKAKMKGQPIVVAKEEPRPKVVSLMDALRRSLEQAGRDRRRPPRAAKRKSA
jgi:DNA end-binding protein Ku